MSSLQKLPIMSLGLPIMAGCLISCCLNIFIYNMQIGKSYVHLNNNLDHYDNNTIPASDAQNVNLMQTLKWSIIPGIFNLIIWCIIIWFITRKPAVSTKSDTDKSDEPI